MAFSEVSMSLVMSDVYANPCFLSLITLIPTPSSISSFAKFNSSLSESNCIVFASSIYISNSSHLFFKAFLISSAIS